MYNGEAKLGGGGEVGGGGMVGGGSAGNGGSNGVAGVMGLGKDPTGRAGRETEAPGEDIFVDWPSESELTRRTHL